MGCVYDDMSACKPCVSTDKDKKKTTALCRQCVITGTSGNRSPALNQQQE